MSDRRNTYIKTARSTHVLTLTECKTHLRVDNSADDTYITSLLYASENQAETILRRSLLATTLVLQADTFPACRSLELDRGPVSSITSVQYVDGNDATQTLAGSSYTLDNKSIPDVVQLEPDLYWPDIKRDRRNAITVEYVAGYASAAAVPVEITLAILQLIAHWYSNREAVVMGPSGSAVPEMFASLLWPHRDMRF